MKNKKYRIIQKIHKYPLFLVLPTLVTLCIGVLVLSLAFGTKESMEMEFDHLLELYGKNTYRIIGANINNGLVIDDLNKLSQLGYVQNWAIQTNQVTKFNSRSQYLISIYGISKEFFYVCNFKIKEGRAFLEEEEIAGARKIILGSTLAKYLFSGTSPVGQEIKIGNSQFEVIGVLAEISSDRGIECEYNQNAFVPYTNFYLGKEAFMIGQSWIKLKTDYSMNKLSKDLTRIWPGKKVELSRQSIFWELLSKTKKMISDALIIVSIIIFILTGINVLNLNLTSLFERKKEIGIRRAMGAKRNQIIWLFLREGMVLIGIGGLLGICLAKGFLFVVPRVLNEIEIFIGLKTFSWVLLSMLVIILFSSFYPAYVGGQIPPHEAIQEERLFKRSMKKSTLKKIFVLISIAIGIIGITSIMIISDNVNQKLTQITRQDENLMVVKNIDVESTSFLQPPKMTYEVYNTLSEELNETAKTLWLCFEDKEISFGNYNKILSIGIFDGDLFDVYNFSISPINNNSNLLEGVYVGSNLQSIFESEKVRKLKIGDKMYQIIAYVEFNNVSVRQSEFDFNNLILLPGIVQKPNKFTSSIHIRLKSEHDINNVVLKIKQIFAQFFPGKAEPYIKKPIDSITKFKRLFPELKKLFWGYGFLGLFIGVVGIMNMMSVSILTRKKELAIRKSVGANATNLRVMVLVESLQVTTLGALIGLIIALTFNYIISKALNFTISFSFNWIILIIILAGNLGLIAALYPIKRMEKYNLAEVLKVD